MRLPIIQGIIRRRILANFRVDPEIMQSEIPSRFRPKLQNGFAVAGICLIRLEHIRPRSMPEIIGLKSENAAHRVAVIWDEGGVAREGVFIYSSYFSDETKFPRGTIEFDHALIMRNVEHEWHSADDLYV